jgi:WASH complex subunit strumpellin
VQANIDLIELEENFRESYMEVIERFFQLFDSIYNYYKDQQNFIANLHEGYFIDYSLETILQNQEGKRLIIEVYFLYGVMLLLMDRLIPCLARERLVVCYLRYKGQNASDFTNEVCKLCKKTEYFYNSKTKEEKLPKNYPVDYFSRFPIDRTLIESFINTLKDDDIYSQLSAYPNPEHRSVALSQ